LSFSEFIREGTELVGSSIDSLNFPIPNNIEWQEPPNAAFGDISFRVSFDIARKLHSKPGEISAKIAERIQENISKRGSHYVSRAEGHPSGFLNLWLDLSKFEESVLSSATDLGYGSDRSGKGSSVLVEHTAANPNKAMHIGHLRNIAIGDCVARLFRFCGYDVSVLNYVDDLGLQVADVLVGLTILGLPKDAPQGKKYDHYIGDDVYVKVNREYERNPALELERKKVLKALEEGENNLSRLSTEITGKILFEQLKTAWRFNAFYDLLCYESDIIRSKLWDTLFETLKEKKIAKYETSGKFAGCWTVTVRGETEGEEKVLVRSDGTATYVAKDLPFAALKVGLIPDKFAYEKYCEQPNGASLWRTRSPSQNGNATTKSPVPWGAGRNISVIGSEQSRLQRIVQYVLSELGGTNMREKYVHLGYSLLYLTRETLSQLPTISDVNDANGDDDRQESEGRIITMSGRRGTYINADSVIELVREKALGETKKRHPEEAGDEPLSQIAEKLAISALRFALLKQDLDKSIVFDTKEALQMVGETGPYMLYSYARATSITSKVSNTGGTLGTGPVRAELLKDQTEIALIKQISKFELAIARGREMLAPKWIAHYSFELCEAFNTFYEKNRVLQESNVELKDARIRVVQCFRSVLKSSLSILGIDVLDRI
jgi:arginyl-tRNA synthetase